MSGDWKYLAGGVGGAILNELITVGPRVRMAHDQGVSEGWQTRNSQLQPVIRQLEARTQMLIAALTEARMSNTRLQQENESIRKALETANRKALPGGTTGAVR